MPEAIQVKKKAESKPWKDICCSRCFVAKSEKKKCKCHCHGEHHAEAYKSKPDKSNDAGDIADFHGGCQQEKQ